MNTSLNQPLMSTHQFHLIMMRSEGPPTKPIIPERETLIPTIIAEVKS